MVVLKVVKYFNYFDHAKREDNMTPHAKVYYNYFDLIEIDFVVCEMCGKRATDIHHVNGRGKDKDVIINLMALCRPCHIKSDSAVNKAVYQAAHEIFLENH